LALPQSWTLCNEPSRRLLDPVPLTGRHSFNTAAQIRPRLHLYNCDKSALYRDEVNLTEWGFLPLGHNAISREPQSPSCCRFTEPAKRFMLPAFRGRLPHAFSCLIASAR
jgi:hypothetical protein